MSVFENHHFWCDSLIDRTPELPCNCGGKSDVVQCVHGRPVGKCYSCIQREMG